VRILDRKRVNVARRNLVEWFALASSSGLKHFVRLAKTIGKRRDGILEYVRTRLNNERIGPFRSSSHTTPGSVLAEFRRTGAGSFRPGNGVASGARVGRGHPGTSCRTLRTGGSSSSEPPPPRDPWPSNAYPRNRPSGCMRLTHKRCRRAKSINTSKPIRLYYGQTVGKEEPADAT